MLPALANDLSDITLVKLANELAVNHFPIEHTLKTLNIDDSTWDHIQRLPRFQQLLRTAIEDWHSAANTHERLKLRAASVVEESLPEMHARSFDPNEPLNAKVEVWKLLARIGNVGVTGTNMEGGGERFSITINLGNDKLLFDKQLPPKVIEGEVIKDG
jgi:uncharacterized protein (UPF0147 family)